MADDGYSVGNLKIAFSALDKTSKDFADLSKNLRAVVNLINRISTADLGKFTANVKEITRAFTPFLNKINKSTVGLQAFNDVAKQVGIKNMSAVVTELDEIERRTRGATESQRELNVEIENGAPQNENYANSLNEVSNSLKNVTDLRRQLIQQSSKGIGLDISKTTAQIKPAEEELKKLQTRFMLVSQSKNLLDNPRAAQSTAAQIQQQEQIVAELKERLRVQQGLVIADYQAQQSARKQRIAYLEAALAMGKAGDQTKEFKKELAKLRKEDGQIGKKSGLSKFLGQVKRIAIYRLIRAGLKEITSAAKEGISAYAQFDSSINQTMSQFTTSFTIIKTSFGATLIPILQAVTPIIQQISVGFANMANVISASMSKTGYYTKINTDRLLAYNKTANLLDFDKFRALKQQDDATGLFSTEKVEDLNDELGATATNYKLIYDIIINIGEILKNVFSIVGQIFNAASPILTVILSIADGILYVVRGITWLIKESGLLYPIVGGILGYFIALGVTKFITWLKTGALATWFKNAAAGASNFGGKLLGVLSTTQALSAGIGALVGSIAYFIQNLDKMGTTAKFLIPIISALAAALTGVAVARAAAAAGIAAPVVAGVTAAALAAAITLAAGTAISVAVGKYANGGEPPKGTLFYAGEAGAEMVYNTPSRQSGVANIQQIKQAVYLGTLQAMKDYGAARGDLSKINTSPDWDSLYNGVTAVAKRRGEKWDRY